MELLDSVENQSSLLARLKSRLNYILHKNSCFEFVYVCARVNGKAVFKCWIEKGDDFEHPEILGDIPAEATSIELDCLYEPTIRLINVANKNSLNSLRGKYGFVLDLKGKPHKFSALQMIAANLSFPGAVEKAFLSRQMNIPDECCITLYKSEQYLFLREHEKEYVPLYRGNRLFTLDQVNKAAIAESVKLMTLWLSNQVNEQGRAEYKYWPSKGEFSDSNNAIRQWMATVCLARAARAFKSEQLMDLANKNLKYNLESMFFARDGLGYILLDGSAKLGAAALAALAILESPERKKYLPQEYALRNLIEHLSNPDGSFDTFYIPRDRTGNENFYSGETLLFMAQEYSISKNPALLQKIMRSFTYYREWHRANRNPAFIPWHTQAYWLVWCVTRDEELARFIFEMNDWLLSMQQWDSAEFLDMQGRFYDPERPFFGPPHASSTGVYLEGLIDAYQLAVALADNARAESYRLVLLRGIRSVIQLQFRDDVESFYVSNKANVIGGVRTNEYDNTIRIDNVQHCLMAFLKIHKCFLDKDYEFKEANSFQVNEGTSNTFNSYKHFRKIEFPIDIIAIRQEIKGNDFLWLENTSRQEKISVQRETNSIFLRAAKKPFPSGVSVNDVHGSHETKNASLYPELMKTLYNFSRSIEAELARVTVVRLLPQSRVYPHVDAGEYYKCRDRYHIVVYSPTGSEMISGGEKVVWNEGEFWWFDNKAIHEAYNNGADYRVHVIFDVLPKP